MRNATLLEHAAAAVVLEQSMLSVEGLTERLRALLGDLGRLAEMGMRARSVAPCDAADTIVEDLVKVIES